MPAAAGLFAKQTWKNVYYFKIISQSLYFKIVAAAEGFSKYFRISSNILSLFVILTGI